MSNFWSHHDGKCGVRKPEIARLLCSDKLTVTLIAPEEIVTTQPSVQTAEATQLNPGKNSQ